MAAARRKFQEALDMAAEPQVQPSTATSFLLQRITVVVVFERILRTIVCDAYTQEAPALLVALATADIRLGDLGAAADSYHRATGDVTVLGMTLSSDSSTFETSTGSQNTTCRCGTGWQPCAVARSRTTWFC